LKVVLTANDTVVAEADDPVLWQKVLTAINTPAAATFLPPAPAVAKTTPQGSSAFQNDAADNGSASEDLSKFAQALGLPPVVLEGACAPPKEPPCMHLDADCWEEMKRQLPSRGPNAIGPGVVAATLLACWFRAARLGNVKVAQVLKVLGNLGVRDQNAHRSIERCEWLQTRDGGVIVLNPAEITKATDVTRKFCSKNWKIGKAE